MSINIPPVVSRLLDALDFAGDNGDYKPEYFVVELTRNCNLQCAHCIVEAGPDRQETLTIEQVRIALDDAKKNGLENVCFYGGEPFMRPQLLMESLEYAYKLGLCSQIMTNGFWGRTPESTKKIFDKIKEVQDKTGASDGLDIILSTDAFHQEKIPLNSVVNIIKEWFIRDDIDVDLCIGLLTTHLSDDREDLCKLLDLIDVELGVTSTGLVQTSRGEEVVNFVDKEVKVSKTLDKQELFDVLEKEELISKNDLAFLKSRDTNKAMDVYRLISVNNLMCLLCSDEDKQNEVYTLGRFLKKQLKVFRGLAILMGRASTFLEDETTRSFYADRQEAARTSQLQHELECTRALILGCDNHFYLHPAQLNYRISSLGKNDGESIKRSIGSVNDGGNRIARILFANNVELILGIVERLKDDALLTKLRGLVDDGCDREALIEGLRDERVVKILTEEM